jgi:hypothetical protein
VFVQFVPFLRHQNRKSAGSTGRIQHCADAIQVPQGSLNQSYLGKVFARFAGIIFCSCSVRYLDPVPIVSHVNRSLASQSEDKATSGMVINLIKLGFGTCQ